MPPEAGGAGHHVLFASGSPAASLRCVAGASRYGTDPNDGTFLMSIHDWMEFYTHLFACVAFPRTWHSDNVEGEWKGKSAGGPIARTGDTWDDNPKFDIVLSELEDTDTKAEVDENAPPK